uniref:Glycerol-3-phosphate dehydrogenase n=1 Tax=Colletotrichum fructicola (strain Nara gc5) TaxID=1213859 RepID=L2FQ04_COLFN
MAEELAWSDARKAAEWSETVRFLQSMGLSQDKLGVTRDDAAAASSGGIKVGLGEIQAGGALARNATSQA